VTFSLFFDTSIPVNHKRLRSLYSVAACFLLSVLSATCQAGLLDSEGFGYSAGDVVGQNGGTGWSGSWANPVSGQIPGAPWGLQTSTMGNRKADASVVSPGLGYSGLATSGNALNVGNLSAYRPWDASSLFTATGQSLWVSFLVNPPSTAASTMYVLPFAQNNPAVAANYQQGSGAKFNTGSSWNVTVDIPGTLNGSGYTTPTPLALTVGQPNLIVMDFNYNGSGTDTIQLWVNPTLGGSAPLGTDASITTGNGFLDQLGEFMVKSGTGVAATLDEINIGTTYGDVTPVPEPATASLFLVSAISGLVVLRRRARA